MQCDGGKLAADEALRWTRVFSAARERSAAMRSSTALAARAMRHEAPSRVCPAAAKGKQV